MEKGGQGLSPQPVLPLPRYFISEPASSSGDPIYCEGWDKDEKHLPSGPKQCSERPAPALRYSFTPSPVPFLIGKSCRKQASPMATPMEKSPATPAYTFWLPEQIAKGQPGVVAQPHPHGPRTMNCREKEEGGSWTVLPL